ncbi:MAG: hypothetical protein EP335_09940 [Alphaproteobacteria bacterium]|nr:MAG: hypothetical protein EP335_09940 [Alphaproteobacteria bacterium]
MKSGYLSLAAVAAVFLSSGAAHADSSMAIVARASTQGLGGELVVPLADRLNVRAGAYGFKVGDSQTASGIDYDLDADLFSTGGYLDWYVFGGGFHLSAGALYNKNKVTGLSVADQTLDIGDHTYTADEVGQLSGSIRVNKFTPYAGIGWGNPVSGDGRIKLLFDLGVMFHGKPQADLIADIPADSPLRDDPDMYAQFQADLAEEVQDFQADVADYKIYPVVSIGLSFSF